MSRLDFIRAKIRNRRANRSNRFAVSAAVVVGLVVLCFATNTFSTSSPHGRAGGRQLMGEGFSLLSAIDGKECSRNLPAPLALIFWIFGVLYMFLAIAIVCDDFFVASLEVITERLDLSDDVAGATFMAAGSSAPELFTSVTGVFFVENVKTDNPGAGTIVGSAVFNIAIIIGGSVIYAKNTLELDWWPLARDGIYYTWAVICVVLVFIGITPGQVDWWEGLMFLIFYALYIVIMKFNTRLGAYFHGSRPEQLDEGEEMDDKMQRSLADNRSPSPKIAGTATETPQHDPHAESHAHEEGHEVHTRPRSGSALTKTYDARPHVIHHHDHLAVEGEHPHAPATENTAGEINVQVPVTAETPAADDDDDEPKGPIGKFIEIIAKPIVFVLSHTIPDCKEKPKWYIVSFSVSVFWIAFISYLMVEFALKMGLCLNLSANVMGLTVLAAGTSVPDALSSFIVAKQGKGNMAVSNAIGSNIFDIFLGLGLPWFMYGAMIERTPLPLNTHGIIYDIMMLFLVLVAFIAIVKLTGWKLKVWQGYLMCSLYAGYVVMALLIDIGTIPTIYHQD